MATSRIVNTKFWRDPYIRKLSPDQKLLFLYLLTNQYTSMAGIYEITVEDMEYETGLDIKFIQKTLTKFQNDHKILYEREWLVVTNFIKHQRLNPSVIKGIERSIDELPEWLQKRVDLREDDDNQLSIFTTDSPQTATVSDNLVHLTKLNLTKPNLTKPNGTDESAGLTEKQKKRQYAIAMDKERDQAKRAADAKTRPSSGLQQFKETQTKLRERS